MPSEKDSKNLELLLTEKCKKFRPCIEGIIYSSEGMGHAVPIILQITNEGPRALLLDALGPNHQYSPAAQQEVVQLLTKLNIPFAQAKEARQADTLSCRTGAVVTLRNALLDLRRNLPEGESIFKYVCIEDIKKPGSTTYSIPDQWAFTDQIYQAKAKPEPDNPRRHYSSKGKGEEPISTSRSKYQKEMEYSYSLNARVNLKKSLNLRDCPENIKITIEGAKLTIKWKETLMQNSYMQEKGLSIAQKRHAQLI